MFNISEELSNFKPVDLENIEQKIGAIPDDMKNAMELYNKALNEINNRNEDIAIIALKSNFHLSRILRGNEPDGAVLYRHWTGRKCPGGF